MPSSTFSFERLTAADRPGIAQPVPQRDIPPLAWARILLAAFLVMACMVAAWEWHWRQFGVEPAIANSDGLWAMQRQRIDHGEGGRTVLVGASRMLFDVDLDTWEQLSGSRPIQLALQGTSPLGFLEDLAKDPKFTGRVLIGVAPDVFFTGFAYRGKVLNYFRHESPGERVGQFLSMHFIEPYFAFDDGDFALATVLQRQAWPVRTGMTANLRVRRLSVSEADRNTRMWRKVEVDPQYQALAKSIWQQDFDPPSAKERAEMDEGITREIQRAAKAVAELRARRIDVIFVRFPSAGAYLDYENRDLPRASTWDLLLEKTGSPGVHFEDYAQLQGYELPEWSHLAAHERPRFTAALYGIVQEKYWTDLPPARAVARK